MYISSDLYNILLILLKMKIECVKYLKLSILY